MAAHDAVESMPIFRGMRSLAACRNERDRACQGSYAGAVPYRPAIAGRDGQFLARGDRQRRAEQAFSIAREFQIDRGRAGECRQAEGRSSPELASVIAGLTVNI